MFPDGSSQTCFLMDDIPKWQYGHCHFQQQCNLKNIHHMTKTFFFKSLCKTLQVSSQLHSVEQKHLKRQSQIEIHKCVKVGTFCYIPLVPPVSLKAIRDLTMPNTSTVSRVWTFPVLASGRSNSKIFPLETTISCILVPADTQVCHSAGVTDVLGRNPLLVFSQSQWFSCTQNQQKFQAKVFAVSSYLLLTCIAYKYKQG